MAPHQLWMRQHNCTSCFFHHALLLFFRHGTVEIGLLVPVARHAGNAGLARDTDSVSVYVALLALGGLRQGCLSPEGWRLCDLTLLRLCLKGNT